MKKESKNGNDGGQDEGKRVKEKQEEEEYPEKNKGRSPMCLFGSATQAASFQSHTRHGPSWAAVLYK